METINPGKRKMDRGVARIEPPGRQLISGLPEIGNLKCPSRQQPTWDAPPDDRLREIRDGFPAFRYA